MGRTFDTLSGYVHMNDCRYAMKANNVNKLKQSLITPELLLARHIVVVTGDDEASSDSTRCLMTQSSTSGAHDCLLDSCSRILEEQLKN